MKLIPTDDVSRFQMFSLLFLVSILASTFIGAAAFCAVLLLFAILCFFISQPLAPAQRRQAYVLFGMFSLFGAGALFAGGIVASPVQALGILPFMVLGFLALFVAVKLYVVEWKAECKVVGYSEGYAVVEVAPAILCVVPAGKVAVKSKPVAKGRRARLVFERKIFGSATKPIGLELQ